jgi:fructan beta-fructosidase
MSNWRYAQDVPTAPWRSAMTLPRELILKRTTRGLEIHSLPVAELKTLRVRNTSLSKAEIREGRELFDQSPFRSGQIELRLELKLNKANIINLEFTNEHGERTLFRIDLVAHRYELDRARSGTIAFSKSFTDVRTAPILANDSSTRLHVFLDHSHHTIRQG